MADLLFQFERIEKFYPKVEKLEAQLLDVSIALAKNKDAHKNKIGLTELEAFKLATRTEFSVLIEHKLEQ